MKTKITISLLVAASFLLNVNVSHAQIWSQTGANIYPTTITDYVGIGLATPLFPLEVSSYTNQGTLSSGNNYHVGIGTESGALIGGQSSTFNAVFGTLYTNKDILFANYNGSTFNERMRIKYTGNVGIGTATPDVSALLDVNSSNKGVLIPRVALTSTSDATTITTPATSLLVYNILGGGLTPAGYWYNAGSSGTPNWVQLISTATSGSWLLTGNSISSGDFIGTTNNMDFIVKTNNTEKMRVLSGGNVGIGTTTPASKLDIEGGISVGATYSGASAAPTNGAIIEGSVGIGTAGPSVFASTDKLVISSATAGDTHIRLQSTTYTAGSSSLFYNAGSGEFRLTQNDGGVGMSFYTGGTAAERMRISPAGNVGIGTTAPGYKLDVIGDAHVSTTMYVENTGTATYALTINGKGLAVGGAWDISDQQFKTEIDSLQGALAKIKQLKPVTYYFDTANVYGLNFSEKKQYGFLAQELEQVLPDVVTESIKNADTLGNVIHPAVTFKAINYTELIAILTKGIQELEQKNDSLQLKANNQDSINSALQNQIITNNTLFQNQLNELQASINNCCSSTRSMHIGSDTQSQLLPQMDVKLSDAQSIVLEQNVPNPFAEQTTINYILPDNTIKAQMLFYNSNGKLIQSTELLQKGKGQLNVFASDLSSGIYTYTLVIDGKIVETKKMIKQ